jgi:sirohydrochlorin cobaltochelatase
MSHENKSKSEKKGILIVHFGTVKKETRERTLDSININVSKNFPEFQVKEAYISNMIIKKIIENEGIIKKTPKEALEEMLQEGFTHVVIQGTHVVNGAKFDSMKEEINEFQKKFLDFRLGNPLLTSTEDYIEAVEIFSEKFKSKTDNVVLVGHGTKHHSNSAYGMLHYILRSKEINNFYVGTVEGYPELEDLIIELKRDMVKRVVLVPFMIVAGNHVSKDLNEKWKKTLEAEGFEVDIYVKGMGEMPEIQNIYVRHISDALNSEA